MPKPCFFIALWCAGVRKAKARGSPTTRQLNCFQHGGPFFSRWSDTSAHSPAVIPQKRHELCRRRSRRRISLKHHVEQGCAAFVVNSSR